jgi:hypothetical protein
VTESIGAIRRSSARVVGAGREPGRDAVNVDRYAKFQIRRRFRLTGTQAAILLDVVLLADWRDPYWSWSGTITELHEDNGFSRRTITDTFDVLDEVGLFEIEVPFMRGQQGTVRIPVYEWLVKVRPSQVRSRQSARDFAPTSRPARAPLAPRSRSGRANERESRHEIPTNAVRGAWGNGMGEEPRSEEFDEAVAEPSESAVDESAILSGDELDELMIEHPLDDAPAHDEADLHRIEAMRAAEVLDDGDPTFDTEPELEALARRVPGATIDYDT